MKALLHHVGVRLAVIMTMVACVSPVKGADDINQIFQMGRAAYYQGDMETAYQLLTAVEARNPNHFETKALLAQIRTRMKPTGSLKKNYEAVIIPKIEFSEVTLQEAVDGLRGLSKAASSGKVVPNIIIKDPALATKTISLDIRNLPLSEAIQYVGDLAGAKTVYDKHAVMFVSAATAGN